MVIPNFDLIDYIAKLYAGTKLLSGAMIDWISLQMSRAILAKKEALRKRKPGSIVHYEPKFIWVNAAVPPYARSMAEIAYKFNKCMMEVLAPKEDHFILNMDEKLQDASFFTCYDLNGTGTVKFWYTIDNFIEDLDYKRISLKPTSPNTKVRQRNEEQAAQQFRFRRFRKKNKKEILEQQDNKHLQ